MYDLKHYYTKADFIRFIAAQPASKGYAIMRPRKPSPLRWSWSIIIDEELTMIVDNRLFNRFVRHMVGPDFVLNRASEEMMWVGETPPLDLEWSYYHHLNAANGSTDWLALYTIPPSPTPKTWH